MDYRSLYKSHANNTNRSAKNRNQLVSNRAASRQKAHLGNRVIDADQLDSPEVASQSIERPTASTSTANPRPRLPITERVKRLRELRERNKHPAEKRSPFVSTVPVGRIIPSKRDLVSEHMKKFRERMERASASKKRPEEAPRRKPVSSGKKPSGAKPKIVKPVMSGQPFKVPNSKKRRSVTKVSNSKTSPIAGPSHDNASSFIKPTLAPTFSVPAIKTEVVTPQVFTFGSTAVNSFITSTAYKNSGGNQIVALDHNETNFFDDISPLADDTIIEPEAGVGAANLLNVENEQLNATFTHGGDVQNSPMATEAQVEVETELQPLQVDNPPVTNNDAKITSIDRPKRRRWSHLLNELNGSSGSVDNQPNKSRRLSTDTDADPKKQKRIEAATRFASKLTTTIERFNQVIGIWSDYKNDEAELEETAIDMINAAIGQAELLMRKKFSKFHDLIKIFANNEETDGKLVLEDDLDGFWTMVEIEVADIDRRFAELEQWKANNWSDPIEHKERKVVKAKRQLKKTGKASAGLKALISNLRKNKVSPNELKPVEEAAKPVEAEESEAVAVVPVPTVMTPKRHTPKRRSLNCSGCTPRKSVRKSLMPDFDNFEFFSTPINIPLSNSVANLSNSNHSMLLRSRCSSVKKDKSCTCLLDDFEQAAALTPKSGSKPKASTRKLMVESFDDLNGPEVHGTTSLKNVFRSAIEKSNKKSTNKSVMFAVDENTPSPSTIRKSMKKRVIKTPKPSLMNVSGLENDQNAENIDEGTPIDTSKVTMTRGSSRRGAAMISTPKGVPMGTPVDGSRRKSRRSKLF